MCRHGAVHYTAAQNKLHSCPRLKDLTEGTDHATPAPYLMGWFISIALIALSAAIVEPAYAQAGDSDANGIEEITVTGSRITRRDFSAPSPVATIDRATLDSASQPTLEEVLNRMPQITPDLERTANNPGDGTARINLRGLGSNRTLVLLNGRRFAPSGVATAIDINNLPQSLVDRVEVITGGASTVYGSDAVAGVVNFITRRDLHGFNVDASTYVTEQGDGNVNDLNIAVGHNFGNGKGNITLYGGYYDRQEVFASARSFTAIPIEDADGMLTQSGSLATPSSVVTFPPVDFGSGPAMTTFDANGLPVEFMEPSDRYNFAPLNYLQTPLTRTSAGVFFDYDVGSHNEFYAELGYTRNDSKQNLAPVPTSDLYLTNLDNPLLDPATQQFFANNFAPPFLPPGFAGFFLSRRLEELGPRIFDRTRDYSRAVAGFRGDLGKGWDYDVWLSYTSNEESSLLKNGASAARFQQGLFVDSGTGSCFDPTGGCQPLNIWGAGNLSAPGIDFLRLPDLVNRTTREQRLVSGFVRGSPLATWAGDIDVAIGAEWRSDDGRFTADDALFSGDALGFRGSAGVDGKQRVYEIYGEAVVPLADNAAFADYLGLELGARYSDYDNAGSVNTYKIGAEWEVVEGLRIRSMFQHSVRAPNIAEAFQARFVETFAYVGGNPAEDPCSASADPVGNGNVDACIATGLPANQIGTFEATVGVPTDFLRGGNPALRPEEADTFTAGVVVRFGESQDWQLSIDYFDLEIEGTIGDLEATVACFDPANTANLFCDSFTRDPNNFNVIELVETKINRGGQRTIGYDTQVQFKSELPAALGIGNSGATLSGNLAWTHTLRNSIRELSFGTTLQCAGRFGFPCNEAADGLTYPDDRISTNLSYRSGDIGLFLNWRWIGGTDNAEFLVADFLGTPVPDLVISEIGSVSYLDLGVGYQLTDRIRLRLNVSNVLDNGPPMMADAVTSNNTDTRMYDIFGRSYSFRVYIQ